MTKLILPFRLIALCFILISFLLLQSSPALGQGCVAVRPMSCSSAGVSDPTGLLHHHQWQFSANYRYFRSFRHFRGDTEEESRVSLGTEVINISHAADLGLSYGISERLSVSANLPVLYYDRSSLYEHYGNSTNSNPEHLRFHTKSSGIGDARLGISYWLTNPEAMGKGNISVGLGLKLPTGNPGVSDDFHKIGADGQDSLVRRPVDQSIQPGDGGLGFNLEVQGFRQIFHRGTLYVNGFYLFNPRNTNNTLTRGTLNGVDPLIAYLSVADQFAARLGVNYLIWPQKSMVLSLGARAEGVPAKDALGESDGFRRPGYIVSAEPGLYFMHRATNFFLTVPVALYRNRVKSTYDRADPSGQRHGDAAFADYLVNVGAVWRL
ncbi:MAG: hypothetical protein IPL65_19620 [Lewinellaceae bacterium]|nr:hypothetical protein [Lewinellaceae bacterium]